MNDSLKQLFASFALQLPYQQCDNTRTFPLYQNHMLLTTSAAIFLLPGNVSWH